MTEDTVVLKSYVDSLNLYDLFEEDITESDQIGLVEILREGDEDVLADHVESMNLKEFQELVSSLDESEE